MPQAPDYSLNAKLERVAGSVYAHGYRPNPCLFCAGYVRPAPSGTSTLMTISIGFQPRGRGRILCLNPLMQRDWERRLLVDSLWRILAIGRHASRISLEYGIY
jgi:hypothetical protein